MLEKYKGENPDNVVGLEEHKKRPFYKKVSFWVLSALGLFFASCSIYGLVLGSQYVRAVTEAAHIIADANSEETTNENLKKNKTFAFGDYTDVCVIDLGEANWTKYVSTNYTVFFFDDQRLIPGVSTDKSQFACDYYTGQGYNFPSSLYANFDKVCMQEPNGIRFSVIDKSKNNMTGTEFKSSVSGLHLYFRPNPNYVGDSAYTDIYEEGHQDGYLQGYDDARAELLNTTEVDFSVAAEMWPQDVTFTLTWYLDGVVEETRSVVYRGSNGWSGFTFYREPLQVGRLVVESDSYTPFWLDYSNEPFNDELHSPSSLTDDNAYDFDNSKWYIPSYWSDLYLRINGGSQPPSDLYDIYIDPNHNDRARVGLWEEGYDQGYQDGMTNYGGQYDNGYNAGYEDGRREGVTEGYNRGVQDGTTGGKALMNMFVTAFQQPFNQIYRFLNFNLLGINLLSLFTALLTLSVGIIIIKKVL